MIPDELLRRVQDLEEGDIVTAPSGERVRVQGKIKLPKQEYRLVELSVAYRLGKLILTESHPVRVVSDDANDVEAGTEITKIEPGKLQDSEAKDLKEGCKVIFGTRVAKLTGARKLLQNTEVFQVWFRPADHGVETFWVPLYGYLTKGDPPEVFEQSASQSVSSDSSLVRQPTPESFFFLPLRPIVFFNSQMNEFGWECADHFRVFQDVSSNLNRGVDGRCMGQKNGCASQINSMALELRHRKQTSTFSQVDVLSALGLLMYKRS